MKSRHPGTGSGSEQGSQERNGPPDLARSEPSRQVDHQRRAAPIEVLAIRRLDGKSNVKAFCDVQIGGVTLKGCKIVQQDGQKPWLATPSVKTDHGWQNVVELSKALREAATEVVLAAWATHQ